MAVAGVRSFVEALGSAAADGPGTLDRPCPFERAPLKCLPFAGLPFASLPFAGLPFALPPAALPFRLRFNSSFNPSSSLSRALAACFSAFFKAFRSALAFRRNRSALASARFLLRFFSQASHLHPIGFKYALK